MRHALHRVGGSAMLVALGLIVAGCSYGSLPDRRTDFVLHYAADSTEPDAAARAVIARAAAAARAAPDLSVTVAGFADAPLSPEANQIRSRIRQQRVADALLADGIARARITLSPRRGLGADPGSESGRVEIRIGG